MKTLKTSIWAVTAALAFTSMATNVIAGIIPIDANGNGHWGPTNGPEWVYTSSGSYHGINGNGLNNGAFASIGLTGLVVESTNFSCADIAWATTDTNGGSFISGARLETRNGFKFTGGEKELQFGWTANYVGGFGYEPNMLLGDNYSTCTTGFSIGQGLSPTTPPANGLFVAGAMATDSGGIYSDGSGNLSAQSFITLSDRTRKENIKPIPQGKSLEMARSLPDFSWNFKAQTQTEGEKTSPTDVAANHTQLGPMAQDWHAVTGLDDGRHISLTAMQGLLLGAVKDLADQLPSRGTVVHSTDSTDGYGAGLIKWDNDYIYVSTGTNQWRRAALATW